ncbi:hypothetical protein MLD38_023391, partial [Melastoma candidum]
MSVWSPSAGLLECAGKQKKVCRGCHGAGGVGSRRGMTAACSVGVGEVEADVDCCRLNLGGQVEAVSVAVAVGSPLSEERQGRRRPDP